MAANSSEFYETSIKSLSFEGGVLRNIAYTLLHDGTSDYGYKLHALHEEFINGPISDLVRATSDGFRSFLQKVRADHPQGKSNAALFRKIAETEEIFDEVKDLFSRLKAALEDPASFDQQSLDYIITVNSDQEYYDILKSQLEFFQHHIVTIHAITNEEVKEQDIKHLVYLKPLLPACRKLLVAFDREIVKLNEEFRASPIFVDPDGLGDKAILAFSKMANTVWYTEYARRRMVTAGWPA